MLDIKKTLAKLLNNCTCDLLYNGSSTGTVSLSKSVANYNKIIVCYADNDGTIFTKEIINNGSAVFSVCFESVRVTGSTYLKNYLGHFDGANLVKSYNKQWALGGTPTDGNYIYIKKVYGCKNIVGGVLRRLVNTLQSLAFKEVVAC